MTPQRLIPMLTGRGVCSVLWGAWYLLHVYILLYMFNLIYAPPLIHSSMTLELALDTALIVVGYVVLFLSWTARKWRVTLINTSAIVVTMLLILIVGFTGVTQLLSDLIVIDEQPLPSDAIILMMLGLDDHTLSLYRAGYANKILMLGDPDFDQEALARHLQPYGLPPEAITFVGQARNTYEGVTLMARYLRDHGLTQGLLVTAPLYTYRTTKAFAKQGVRVISTPLPLPPLDQYTPMGRFRVRQAIFFRWLHEVIGVGYYALRGRL